MEIKIWQHFFWEFPFPSNGKAHSDIWKYDRCYHIPKVSIPFKREGTFRPLRPKPLKVKPYTVFPFPSNGKAHSDILRNGLKTHSLLITVSIPFKREGTFRRRWSPARDGCPRLSFHSLQTGRAHSDKNKYAIREHKLGGGFNSLQTGRHIQTIPHIKGNGHHISFTRVSIPFKREGTFRPRS